MTCFLFNIKRFFALKYVKHLLVKVWKEFLWYWLW